MLLPPSTHEEQSAATPYHAVIDHKARRVTRREPPTPMATAQASPAGHASPPSASHYDAIVIGSGHNGLIAGKIGKAHV